MTTATAKTKSNKATHYGECQCCGHKQKLPNGRLSLHGYTKQWGFFQGVCYGAGHLPYEQDKSLCEAALVRAEAQLKAVEEEIAALRTNSNPEDVRDTVYVRSVRGRSQYRLVSGRLTMEFKPFSSGDGGYNVFHFHYTLDGEEKSVKVDVGFESSRSIESAALKMNTSHASLIERQTATQLRTYIAWLRKRIADWQPKELTPVE